MKSWISGRKFVFALVLVLGVFLLAATAAAQETTPSPEVTEVVTEVPTQAPTEIPTEAPTQPTPETTTAPTPEGTVEATPEATTAPTLTPTPEGTVEATPEATAPPTEEPGQEPPLTEIRSEYAGLNTVPAIPTEGNVQVIVQVAVVKRELPSSTGEDGEAGETEPVAPILPSAAGDVMGGKPAEAGSGAPVTDLSGVIDVNALPDTLGIAEAQNALLAELAAYAPTVLHTYEYMPFMALDISQDGLAALRASARVVSVQLDEVNRLHLEQSTVRIGARSSTGRTGAWEQGWDGSGRYVAILDTGVLANHTFITPGVTHQACYSTGGGSYLNNCPGGSEGPGVSASPATCHTNTGASGFGCDHGTHVAGIAAGWTPGNINTINGVARGANIIAVNVFSTYTLDCNPSQSGTQRCPIAFDSDILAALDYVYDLRAGGLAVDSANMSLGGGVFTTTCDASYPAYASIINSLKNIGVATVISSGNDGYFNAISKPGCISSAVTVGATNDTSDAIALYSNEAFFLDLLAPGSNITSSVSNLAGATNLFGTKNGTSMAAPHVAGAFAVLRERSPQASVDAILNTLRGSGTPVSSYTGAFTFYRINVDFGLYRGLVNMDSPDNQTVYTTTPLFSFSPATNATWYELATQDRSTFAITHQQWYQVGVVLDEADAAADDPNAPAAGAFCSGGMCTLRPSAAVASNLNNHNLFWWIRAWGPSYPGGQPGEWIGPLRLTVSSPAQCCPSNGETVNEADGTVTFTWDDVAGLSHYQLYVYDLTRSAVLVDTWYTDGGICDGNECGVTRGWMADGAYYWWVRGWSSEGYTLWRGARIFYQNAPFTGTPTLGDPIGTINTNEVDFNWNAVTGATWYQLWVNGPSGNQINEFITSSACFFGACGVERDLIGEGVFTWWVRAYGPDGWGNWTSGRNFTITPQPAPTGLGISSVAADRGDQVYTWTHNPRSTWYQVWISDNTTVYHQDWVQVGSGASCGSTCNFRPNILLTNGSSYRFWVRAYGLAGFSSWTGPFNFSIALAAPNAGGFDLGQFRIFNNENVTTFDDPFYVFNDIAGASRYGLAVYRSSPNPAWVYIDWHNRSGLGCGDGSCTIIPPIPVRYLVDGQYQWYVGAWGPGGSAVGGAFGMWSGAATFTMDHANIAGLAPTPGTPANGSTLTTSNTPTISFPKLPGGTFYELAVYSNTAGNWVYYEQRQQNSLGCYSATTNNLTCSWALTSALANGSYTYFLRAYGPHNNGTYSNWTGGTTFNIALPAPAAPEVSNPSSGEIFLSNNVSFSWTKEDYATWYFLEIRQGSNIVHGVWYAANDVCGSSTCSAPVTLPGAFYRVRVASYGWGTNWPNLNYSPSISFTVLE